MENIRVIQERGQDPSDILDVLLLRVNVPGFIMQTLIYSSLSLLRTVVSTVQLLTHLHNL